MTERHLHITLAGYWHAGTGKSGGTHVDALTDRDHDNLPFVGGKHLKGLLRHAYLRAVAWQWLATELPSGPAGDWETLLFGSRSQVGASGANLPGMLLVDDARLAVLEQDYLKQNNHLSHYCYDSIYSTAITARGAAAEGSLRGMEVCVPLVLSSRLQLALTAVDAVHRSQQEELLSLEAPWEDMANCLPLIDAIGAHRTRGLGEAVLSLSKTPLLGGVST
jgi:hypothetical protein